VAPLIYLTVADASGNRLVRSADETSGTPPEPIEWMPAGTPVDRRSENGQQVYVIGQGADRKTVAVPPGANVRLVRATDVPEKYQNVDSAAIELTVRPGQATYNFALD